MSPLPLPDWHGFSMVSCGPFLYLIGGITRGKWTGAVFRCDTRDGTFEALPPMATPRRRCAAVVASIPRKQPPKTPSSNDEQEEDDEEDDEDGE